VKKSPAPVRTRRIGIMSVGLQLRRCLQRKSQKLGNLGDQMIRASHSTMICLFVGASAFADTPILTGTPRLEAVELVLDRTIDRDGCIGEGVVDLPDIQFKFGSSSLTPDAATSVNVIAQVIRRNSFDHFVIEGHTDAKGTTGYNLGLSKRRAEEVGAQLRASGVPQVAFSLRWFGEDRLRYPDMPEHPHNRRVTLVRIGPNSAMYDSAFGSSDLSYRIMAAPGNDPAQAYSHDQAQPMSSGTWFFLCVAARQNGYLSIEHRSNVGANFESLGAWRLPAGALARAPEIGTLQVTGPSDIEHLRLRHVADTAECRGSSHTVPENITMVDTRPQATAVAVSPGPGAACQCGTPGVACTDLRIVHQ